MGIDRTGFSSWGLMATRQAGEGEDARDHGEGEARTGFENKPASTLRAAVAGVLNLGQ